MGGGVMGLIVFTLASISYVVGKVQRQEVQTFSSISSVVST